MTELYIDNNPVVLSADLSFDFFQKNPAFTRQGEYTYDIDIDLRVSQNAQVYYHLDRLHVEQLPENRRAILLVNGKVLIVGTEIILSVENGIAKIQIVSGYSELNYLAKDDEKIRDFDFGQIPEINAAMALESLNFSFPERNYCFPKIWKNYKKEANTYGEIFNNTINDANKNLYYVEGTTLVAQPYLLFYMEKIVELLGYKLIRNDLREDDVACKIYCVNGILTTRYNEMIPNWTVNKFLTETEQFFNVIYLVDRMTKEVSIIRSSAYYNSSSEVVIPSHNVLKSFERIFSKDDRVSTDYSNVNYAISEGGEYGYYDVDEEIFKACEKIEFDTFSEMNNAIDKKRYQNTLTIFYVKELDKYFIIKWTWIDGGESNRTFYEVNILSGIKKGGDNKIELSIIPAEIYQTESWLSFPIPVPYARNQGLSASGLEQNSVQHYIENGVKKEELTGNLYVAIFIGVSDYTSIYHEAWGYENAEIHNKYPLSIISPLVTTYYFPRRGITSVTEYNQPTQFAEDRYDLSFRGKEGMYFRYYNTSLKTNINIEFKIEFKFAGILDPMSIFIIDYKKYLCKQLKRTVLANGMDEIVEGIFYAM